MSFIQETIAYSQDIWDECLASPFVQEIKDTTLPMEKFKEYMIQDSIYLKNYAKVFGGAIYHATTLKEIQMYYSSLAYVNDTESTVRTNYLKRFGITDDEIELIKPEPENKNYIDFMMAYAAKGNQPEILMATMPCLLSYIYIFKIVAKEDIIYGSPFEEFVSEYLGERIDKVSKQWCDFVDEKCDNLPKQEKVKLMEIFREGSRLELEFWRMAYRGKSDE